MFSDVFFFLFFFNSLGKQSSDISSLQFSVWIATLLDEMYLISTITVRHFKQVNQVHGLTWKTQAHRGSVYIAVQPNR